MKGTDFLEKFVMNWQKDMFKHIRFRFVALAGSVVCEFRVLASKDDIDDIDRRSASGRPSDGMIEIGRAVLVGTTLTLESNDHIGKFIVRYTQLADPETDIDKVMREYVSTLNENAYHVYSNTLYDDDAYKER